MFKPGSVFDSLDASNIYCKILYVYSHFCSKLVKEKKSFNLHFAVNLQQQQQKMLASKLLEYFAEILSIYSCSAYMLLQLKMCRSLQELISVKQKCPPV